MWLTGLPCQPALVSTLDKLDPNLLPVFLPPISGEGPEWSPWGGMLSPGAMAHIAADVAAMVPAVGKAASTPHDSLQGKGAAQHRGRSEAVSSVCSAQRCLPCPMDWTALVNSVQAPGRCLWEEQWALLGRCTVQHKLNWNPVLLPVLVFLCNLEQVY